MEDEKDIEEAELQRQLDAANKALADAKAETGALKENAAAGQAAEE